MKFMELTFVDCGSGPRYIIFYKKLSLNRWISSLKLIFFSINPPDYQRFQRQSRGEGKLEKEAVKNQLALILLCPLW